MPVGHWRFVSLLLRRCSLNDPRGARRNDIA